MARHKELAQATGMRVYFCDPHSFWQKGSCENTNGLLRQFLLIRPLEILMFCHSGESRNPAATLKKALDPDFRAPLKTHDFRPIKRVSKQEFRQCLIFKQIRRVLGVFHSFSSIPHAFAVFRRAWLFDGLATL